MNVENMHLYYDPHISFYIINIGTGYYKYYIFPYLHNFLFQLLWDGKITLYSNGVHRRIWKTDTWTDSCNKCGRQIVGSYNSAELGTTKPNLGKGLDTDS